MKIKDFISANKIITSSILIGIILCLVLFHYYIFIFIPSLSKEYSNPFEAPGLIPTPGSYTVSPIQ